MSERISRSGKREDKLHKMNMYKDAAKHAMDCVSNFDAKIIDANNDYLERLSQADQAEYNILMENMKNADTEEERAAIRARLKEMKKEQYTKDTENKKFYQEQQDSHKNYTLKILGSFAVVTGLVATYTFRKPLMDAGKKLITKI